MGTCRANGPGTLFVPGTAMIMSKEDSVKGVVKIDIVFHENYTPLEESISLTIEGTVQDVAGGVAEGIALERSLRRASGEGPDYIIRFTCGIHPAVRYTGRCFLEDQRVLGYNAVGLGLPCWAWWRREPSRRRAVKAIALTRRRTDGQRRDYCRSPRLGGTRLGSATVGPLGFLYVMAALGLVCRYEGHENGELGRAGRPGQLRPVRSGCERCALGADSDEYISARQRRRAHRVRPTRNRSALIEGGHLMKFDIVVAGPPLSPDK